jgi:perosamine synthetase
MTPTTKTTMFFQPGFPYRLMFSSNRHRLPRLFDREGVKFYLRGSTALWHGLKVLRLSPGQTILFPSYHCGVELDVIRKAGLRVVFYRIGRDLSIDLDELRRLEGAGTRAVYVIHYFGFPHPMNDLRQFCAANGLALIEDCAHALFAEAEGRPAGSSSDFAIFSLHKYLPVPSGGVLVVNNKQLGRPAATVAPPSLLALRYMIDVLGRDVTRSAFMNTSFSRRLRAAIAQVIYRTTASSSEKDALKDASGSLQFLREWKDARMPRLSRRILQSTCEQQVIERRRRNFAALLETVSDCRRVAPLISKLSDGACPGFFPVTVAGDVGEFLQRSRDHGVPAFLFWPHAHPAFPVQQFPEASWLKNNVAVLPVHQGLGADDLSLLRQVIHSWESSER